MGRFTDRLDSLFANMLDGAVNATTQSSSELSKELPSATSVENQRRVQGELLKLQAAIQKYDADGKAMQPMGSRYFIDHYNDFMVDVREFAQKNAEQTNAATITQAITVSDCLWSDIKRSDPIAKQLERVEPFLEQYSAKLKAETKLKETFESGLNSLKNEAKNYVAGMNDKSVANLETTLNAYDERFVKIRSEIPNPGDPATLKAGVSEPFYSACVKSSQAKVEQVEINPNVGTIWYEIKRNLTDTLPLAILVFVGVFFATLVANDLIHLTKYYRIFFFFFVAAICIVPGPNIYAVPLLGIYYFFKRFLYDSFKRDATATFGFSRDFDNGIAYYAFLPVKALQTRGNFLWSFNELKGPTKIDPITGEDIKVGPNAQEKRFAYLQKCAEIVGATLAEAAGSGTSSLAQLQALLKEFGKGKHPSDLKALQEQLQRIAGSETDLAKLKALLIQLAKSS